MQLRPCHVVSLFVGLPPQILTVAAGWPKFAHKGALFSGMVGFFIDGCLVVGCLFCFDFELVIQTLVMVVHPNTEHFFHLLLPNYMLAEVVEYCTGTQ